MANDVTPQLCEALWDQVCNWARWGDDDQAGALNLVTPAKRIAASRLVSEGIPVGLGNPWPTAPGPHNGFCDFKGCQLCAAGVETRNNLQNGGCVNRAIHLLLTV